MANQLEHSWFASRNSEAGWRLAANLPGWLLFGRNRVQGGNGGLSLCDKQTDGHIDADRERP